MTTEERDLRLGLHEAARRIRSILGRCPAVEELDLVDIDRAARLVNEATDALRDAMTFTAELDELRGASEDAVLLAATSRTALGVVREVLTILTAAIDSRSAAA